MDKEHHLHAMAKLGDPLMVREALKRHQATERDVYGETALHWASNVEVAKILVSAGGSVSMVDPNGDTPLHWACENGKMALVQFYIENGADVNQVPCPVAHPFLFLFLFLLFLLFLLPLLVLLPFLQCLLFLPFVFVFVSFSFPPPPPPPYKSFRCPLFSSTHTLHPNPTNQPTNQPTGKSAKRLPSACGSSLWRHRGCPPAPRGASRRQGRQCRPREPGTYREPGGGSRNRQGPGQGRRKGALRPLTLSPTS